MFELFATGQQLMLLIMAAVFIGIGGLLVGVDVYTRMHGVRVIGTVVGVRESKPNMYHSVYRYSLPSGEGVEAMSNTGSSSAKGRETGRRVPLFAFADRPDQVSEAGVPIMALFGAVFCAAGLWPLYTALTRYPVTPMTGVAVLAAVAWFAYKFRRGLIRKAQRKSPREWMEARRQERAAELATVPVRQIEEVLATPAAQAAAASNSRKMRRVTALLVIVGIGALALSAYLGRGIAHLEAAGLRAPGKVISLAEGSGSNGSSYYPVVRFSDSDWSDVQFRDRTGSNPPSYRVGDDVTVLYLKGSGSRDAIIDRGVWNWLPAGLVGLFGLVLAVVGLRALATRGPQSPGG